jgi:hypothetical protein
MTKKLIHIKWIWTALVLVLVFLLFYISGFNWGILKSGLLASFWFGLKIVVFPLVFVSIQKIIKAQWSEEIENYFIQKNTFLPYLFLVGFPILVFSHDIFPWQHVESHLGGYLNPVFFYIRYAIIGGFFLFSFFRLKKNPQKNKIAFLLIFLFSFIILSIDFIQFYHQNFSSAVFGFSQIAGVLYTGLAFWIFAYLNSEKADTETLNKLGRYLLALSFIWLYFYFYQLIILWYSKLDTQTAFYEIFFDSKNVVYSLFALFFSLVLPFLVLINKAWRRNRSVLSLISLSILLGSIGENALLFLDGGGVLYFGVSILVMLNLILLLKPNKT